MKFSGISLLGKKNGGKKYQNMSPSPGVAPAAQLPNYKTCVISVNYEPISTKFSGISVPTSWQGIGEKMLKNATPSWGCSTPHIFKYSQLLDITDNNERISMKFLIFFIIFYFFYFLFFIIFFF